MTEVEKRWRYLNIITVDPMIRTKRDYTILDPESDLRYIIDQDLGPEATMLYDEVISDLKGYDLEGDDYEKIADGYRDMLVQVMNDLHEIISQPRLNRKRLTEVYERLDKNL